MAREDSIEIEYMYVDFRMLLFNNTGLVQFEIRCIEKTTCYNKALGNAQLFFIARVTAINILSSNTRSYIVCYLNIFMRMRINT